MDEYDFYRLRLHRPNIAGFKEVIEVLFLWIVYLFMTFIIYVSFETKIFLFVLPNIILSILIPFILFYIALKTEGIIR